MLIHLGKENLEATLEEIDIRKWDQAARLQIAATYLGVQCSPPQGILAEWYDNRKTLHIVKGNVHFIRA